MERVNTIEVNKYQTKLTDELLKDIPIEIQDQLFDIINKYSAGTVNLILKWAFVIIMIIFLSYIIKIFIHKKKI